MNLVSELGISPVLLQAISHTLTSSEKEGKAFVEQNLNMDQKSITSARKGVSHILDGMNEPVASLLQRGSDNHALGDANSDSTGTTSQEVKDILQRMKKTDTVDMVYEGDKGDTRDQVYVGGQPISMVNVLTALATQHLKSKDERTSNEEDVKPETGRLNADNGQGNNQQIIIYYNNEEKEVPSPSNDIVVGDMDTVGADGIYRVVVQEDGVENVPAEIVQPTEHQARLIAEHEKQMIIQRQNMLEKRAKLMSQQGMRVSDAETVAVTPLNDVIIGNDPSAIEHLGTPCPICGDRISGYHYGIFTCESCKGFFKRTVQNKKTFVCHRHGECEISVFNRKKCPACRFAKCVQCGMKLEAIRLDRTRGGRSSYDGCSTHGRIKQPPEKKVKRSSVSKVPITATQPSTASNESNNTSHLVAILNHSTLSSQQSGDSGLLQVPELLTDIMNLEPLLSDEEIPLDMIPEGFENDDHSLYTYLMQLSELRLYKLVRWARNLPQFGAISTDDQILLLQNCWSDLLALGVGWRSIATPGVLTLSAGKTIGLKRAQDLGFGDVVGRMISLSEYLRRLEVDQYEYVAMKVLLLISPDVKGLKDPGKIMEHQEKLLDALATYTSAHFPSINNKFGEMILRLPELARISYISKEQLLNQLPSNLTQCGLLVELLKGENAHKDL